MTKVYLVKYGTNYDATDCSLFATLEKAKEAADSGIEFYDYCDVYEYSLINGDYVEDDEAVYEVER